MTTINKIANVAIQQAGEISPYMKSLFYGGPGVGKTYLAASSCEIGRTLMIDIEGGSMTVRDVYPDLEILRIRDEVDERGRAKKLAWTFMAEVYEELRKGCDYDTIIIDSLTEVQRASMYYVMRSVIMKDPDRDEDIPAQRDWGKSGEMVRRLVRAFRDLDCHVIFTALETQARDGDRIVKTTPSLPGKLAFEIAGFVDLVGYLYVQQEHDKPVRRLLTQPVEKLVAKTRFANKIPVVVTNPTMKDLVERAIGGKENG